MSTVAVETGRVLRELREASGLSASAVSRRLGMSAGLVATYERGDRTLSVGRLCDLADLYGMDPGLVLDLIQLRCGTSPVR